MIIRILPALVGMLAATWTVVAAPPVAEIQSASRVDKSVSVNTHGLKVSKIGSDIQVRRIVTAPSAFKSNGLHETSGTLVIAGVPFAKSLASPINGNSVIEICSPTEMKKSVPIDSGDLPPTNHVSVSNKVFAVVPGRSAMKKYSPVHEPRSFVHPKTLSIHPFQKKMRSANVH